MPYPYRTGTCCGKNCWELMQGAVILCIIGTYDPDILAIPFLSAADALAVPVERLPELLRTQRMEKAGG